MLAQPRAATWVQIPGLPFADCVALVRSLLLSETRFPYMQNGNDNCDCSVEFSIEHVLRHKLWPHNGGLGFSPSWEGHPTHRKSVSSNGWPCVFVFCLICVYCYCVCVTHVSGFLHATEYITPLELFSLSTIIWVLLFLMAGPFDQTYYYCVLFLIFNRISSSPG